MSISAVSTTPQPQVAAQAQVRPAPARDQDGDNDGGREVRASNPPGVGQVVDTDA